MSDFDFRGLGVALVTPFDDKGKVDYNCLEMLVRRLVAGNADYIVVLGTTAETPALTPEEKVKIRNIVADTVDGKIPLVLGCGGNCTRTLCEELHEWDGKGYTAILSVTPFYNKPSQRAFTNTLRLWQRLLPCLYCSTMCRAERVSICCRTRL